MTQPNSLTFRYGALLCGIALACGCAVGGSLLLAADGTGEATDGNSDAALEVTYLGNEGYLVESGGTRVLIDALQGPGIPGYTTLPTLKRKSLETGSAGFGDIDLILISHVHPDHFNAESVSRFMKAVPAARVVSTREVKRRLSHDPALAGRVTALEPTAGEPQKLNVAGVDLTAFNMHHGRANIQNLGFHVQMAGGNWLHVGDAALSLAEWKRAKLPPKQTDLFLCPYWHLLGDDALATLDVVGAETVVPTHVPAISASANYFAPAASREELLKQLENAAPNVILMDRLLGSRRFVGRAH